MRRSDSSDAFATPNSLKGYKGANLSADNYIDCFGWVVRDRSCQLRLASGQFARLLRQFQVAATQVAASSFVLTA